MADWEQDAQKGRQAKFELEHPLIVEAFASVETDLMKAWRTSKAQDSEGREQIYQYLKALEAIKSYLRATVDNGKVAEAELEKLKEK